MKMVILWVRVSNHLLQAVCQLPVRKAGLLVCWSCQSRMPQTEWLKQDIYFLLTLEAASLIKVSATLLFSRPFSVAYRQLQTVLWSLCMPLGSLCVFRFPFLYLY